MLSTTCPGFLEHRVTRQECGCKRIRAVAGTPSFSSWITSAWGYSPDLSEMSGPQQFQDVWWAQSQPQVLQEESALAVQGIQNGQPVLVDPVGEVVDAHAGYVLAEEPIHKIEYFQEVETLLGAVPLQPHGIRSAERPVHGVLQVIAPVPSKLQDFSRQPVRSESFVEPA